MTTKDLWARESSKNKNTSRVIKYLHESSTQTIETALCDSKHYNYKYSNVHTAPETNILRLIYRVDVSFKKRNVSMGMCATVQCFVGVSISPYQRCVPNYILKAYNITTFTPFTINVNGEKEQAMWTLRNILFNWHVKSKFIFQHLFSTIKTFTRNWIHKNWFWNERGWRSINRHEMTKIHIFRRV